MTIDVRSAHEALLYHTSFQPSELMQMTEKELRYWLERTTQAYKTFGPKL